MANQSPKLDINKMKDDGEAIVVFKDAEPARSGVSRYGEWFLWEVEIESGLVEDGSGSFKEDYTGPGIVFLKKYESNYLKEKVLNGEQGVKVRITRKTYKGPKGPFKGFNFERLEGGSKAPLKLSDNERSFLNDLEELIKDKSVTKISKTAFIEAARDEPYKIETDRAKKLFEEFKETHSDIIEG